MKRRLANTEAALAESNERVEKYESARRRHDPRQFDLSPEDWRRLGREGTVKLRVPCPVSSGGTLTEQQVKRLGLAPADAEVINQSYRHSEERMGNVVAPICAEVLGVTLEQASRIGSRDCRHQILGRAAREGTALAAYRKAAAYLAGDADEPREQSAVEKLVLALSQEQSLFEEELAEHFGVEKANELVFSQALCFTQATHELGQGEKSSPDGN